MLIGNYQICGKDMDSVGMETLESKLFSVSAVLPPGLYRGHLAACSFQKEHYLLPEWNHSHSDPVDQRDPSPPFPQLDRGLQKKTKKHTSDYASLTLFHHPFSYFAAHRV